MKTVCRVVLVAMLAGCTPPASVAYVPDPTMPIAGWKCPADRQFIPHTNPPCMWIPGGSFFASCWDKYNASINEARGCVRATSTTVRNGATGKTDSPP